MSDVFRDLRAHRWQAFTSVPHHPSDAIGEYRQQSATVASLRAGMLLKAANELSLDLTSSVMFGDRDSDLQAARAAGVPRRVMLATDGFGEVAGKRPPASSPTVTGASTKRLKCRFVKQLMAPTTAG
jgi:histidinol phosphatase-like enzyme